MKVYNLMVEISDVSVDSEYYTFNYKVFVDGKLKEKGEINDDYENGMTPKEFKEYLTREKGALYRVLSRFSE